MRAATAKAIKDLVAAVEGVASVAAMVPQPPREHFFIWREELERSLHALVENIMLDAIEP